MKPHKGDLKASAQNIAIGRTIRLSPKTAGIDRKATIARARPVDEPALEKSRLRSAASMGRQRRVETEPNAAGLPSSSDRSDVSPDFSPLNWLGLFCDAKMTSGICLGRGVMIGRPGVCAIHSLGIHACHRSMSAGRVE
ncbi:MAG: hypothetical protein WDN69_17215 [Aliidongia sp.]